MTKAPDRDDVIVIGGGAAGLSAALVLGRARRSVTVIDAGAPRNAPAAHMQGFLSHDGMPPADLVAAGRAEVTGYGVELIDDQVLGLAPGFDARLAGGRVLRAAAAPGHDWSSRRAPRDRRGPCAVGQRSPALSVLPRMGGPRPAHRSPRHHPGAVQHAQLVRQWSDDVIFFAHTYALSDAERLELDARGVQVVDGEVAGLVVEADRLAGVELSDGQVVARTAVFIRPAIVPHEDGLLAGLGCEFNEAGFVVVDGTGATSAPGVWAAGNAADPRAQVITAAGAGSAAAIAINADLVLEDVADAVAARGSDVSAHHGGGAALKGRSAAPTC